jgi:hypothetical protein
MLSLLIFLFSFSVNAQTSDFQKMLEGEQFIQTKESTVDINGVRYQKIEFDSKDYYIALKGIKQELPVLLCERPSGFKSEHLIEGSLKVERRKLIYINAIKESCHAKNGQVEKSVEVSPEIGVFLPEDKDSSIKNKKIGINPLQPKSLQFSGEF